jgi:acetyl esterase
MKNPTHEATATPVDKLADGPGVSHIDPADPAAPQYRLLAIMRSPVTLRDLMIKPVRDGYIGQEHPIDPKALPPSAASLYPDIEVTTLMVPSPAGPIRCQVFRNPAYPGARPMMLYAHGGGFSVGQSEDIAYIASRLAKETGVIVVGANYRLAPEWPFPAGLDDCVEVYRWLRENGGTIGGDPAKIVVAGDSSGGNFAAAFPHRTRDVLLGMPDAVIALCPLTDFHFEDYPSFERLAPLGIVYDTAFAGFIRGAYAVTKANWSHPHVSPALGDLGDYPPTLVVCGTHDPIVDENHAFAEKLRCAGRTVEVFTGEGMPHGFYFFPGLFPEGDAAFAAMARFLADRFSPAPSGERAPPAAG